MEKNITINIPVVARVEGDGALALEIENNKISSLKLRIFEPPRLFEKFLEGRNCQDLIDIVARICGICPVAYQMSATQAIEHAFGAMPHPWVRTMRRLFYCGEWIESHSLHMHFLAAPDFLGFESAPDMAKVYPDEVRRGMRIQAFGNKLIKLFGGRSVHPVGACVGGFFKAPNLSAVHQCLEEAKNRIQDCEDLIHWLAALKLPDNSYDFTSVSLQHPTEYPMNEGRIVSDRGLDISIEQFNDYFHEFQVPYSNALHCTLHEKSYLVGPLARVNLNYHLLPAEIKDLLELHHINFPTKNMYQSIIARAVEVYYCVLEAIRIMEQYQLPEVSFKSISPRAGSGYGCTEAPRGLLWHHYEFDETGLIKSARIVPPTSQNQARIEEDLRISLEKSGLNQPESVLRQTSEMIIRNYDPCISCSTHFLDLQVRHK